MAYLLDANIFIQAKNLQYGFDFCPAFWDWLQRANANQTVFSIEKVADELAGGADELSQWASPLGPTFFLPPDASVLGGFRQVSAWVVAQPYAPAGVSAFMQGADPPTSA